MLRAILTLRCPPTDGWIRTLRPIWSILVDLVDPDASDALVDAGDEG